MRVLVALALVIAASHAMLFPFSPQMYAAADVGSSEGGGIDCAACTIVIGLMEQKGELDVGGIEAVVDKLCDLFPKGPVQDACTYLIDAYGEDIVRLVVAKETADEVCHDLKICTLYPEVHVFPLPDYQRSAEEKSTLLASLTFESKLEALSPPVDELIAWLEPRVGAAATKRLLRRVDPDFTRAPTMNPWEWLKHLVNLFANLHEPVVDLDADKFGVEPTLRGTSWRGADCDDVNADVYPGRNTTTHGPDVDHNCNGIAGVNDDGQPWEDVLCGGQKNYQVVVVGDSVSAHFELPPQYFRAIDINETTFKTAPDIMWRLANEFDLPFGSFGTGFINSSVDGTVYSLYERFLEQNRCSFNAFQNTGVNGARTGAVANGGHPLMKDASLDQENDAPVMLLFTLSGNDVCNSHSTISSMTSVEDFRQNVLTALDYYETVLPEGSHILFFGLAPGTFLYNTMHNLTHPISPSQSGLPGVVTYTAVYTFLDDLGITPCAGWLNANATIRENTQIHANALSAVYPEIIAQNTYKNFDMLYVSFVDVFETIIKEWVAQGGKASELIEPVGGFHDSSLANPLIGHALVNKIETEMPHWLGEPNPNNDKIIQLFGQRQVYKWDLN